MRITGGRARGIKLQTLNTNSIRPATDKMRQAVFSSIGDNIIDKSILDLFSGSGSLGLEAISRGASRCVFIEKNQNQLKLLKQNFKAVCKSANIKSSDFSAFFYNVDVFKWNPSEFDNFDYIFLDPPFALVEENGFVLIDKYGNFLNDSSASRIVFEMPGINNIKHKDFEIVKKLGHGNREPTVVFYKRKTI